MVILEFFRDFLSGINYWIYLAICVFLFFYILGIVSDRKRLAISNKLKEKKSYDIKSGREAAIAAMETKQVLDVDKTNGNGTAPVASAQPVISEVTTPEAKEEVPQVMVLNSNQEAATQPRQAEPIVFESTPVVNPNVQQ